MVIGNWELAGEGRRLERRGRGVGQREQRGGRGCGWEAVFREFREVDGEKEMGKCVVSMEVGSVSHIYAIRKAVS